MGEKRITSIDLTQDELSFILTLFNLNEISGFAVPADFDEAAASAAGESLLKRGFGVTTPEGQALDPDVAALITIGAIYSVALGLSIPNGGAAPMRYWFYLTPERAVFHSKPKLGTERFELLESGAHLAEVAGNLLNTKANEIKPGYGNFSVAKSVLAQAEMVKANQGRSAAIEGLKARNLPESFALNVIDETQQLIIVTIRVSETAKGEVRAENITTMLIATGGTGYWLIQEDERDPDSLTVIPVDGVKALEIVAQQVAL